MKRLALLVIVPALASCAAMQQQDATACAAALIASGQQTAAGLLQAAELSPACNKLAAEAVQAALREAMLRQPK